MKQRILFYLIFIFCFSASCQNQVAVDDIDNSPVFNKKDKAFENVFKILDGTWKGKFLIYQDLKQLPKDQVSMKDISLKSLEKDGLKLVNSIDVTQVYTSDSPFFQRVTITDFYPDTQKEVVSKGVNKIQDGKVWCVVRKPDETVIHDGKIEGGDTIIWSRDEQSPQRVEYFKETVSENFYEIIGWGYYEGDDTSLSPKLWFYAKYERQK
ncbi:hypothetical protein GWK08_04945 [Leptobacterium flavescens]|uniref:DUF1579 domain-containing protein n=1 Tax=Leptobacterium flavescens TaxID=472055 RepID=A0A6P0UHM3_9FLAO|nr:hypothetical protein [Leptobacterium flavescens]NER12775.1 hypothetical protein [Leptobacterium flavescens]